MNNTVLQIPMNASLRNKSLSVAQDMGFSSLQELIRVFLTKLNKNQVSISISDAVQLSEKNEMRYLKMDKEFENKNVYTAHSVDDLMGQLNE